MDLRPYLSTVLSLTAAFTTLLAARAAVAGDTYNFTDANKRNTVAFVLDAPFESINAVANGIEGSVAVDKGKASGSFKVRVDSIKTGNDTRDTHVQNDKWLDATKWPSVELSFKDLALPADWKDGKAHTVKAAGELAIHGVKRAVEIPVTITYLAASDLTKQRLPGNLVRVKASFPIKLADHGVAQSDSGVKALIGLKVGEVANVSLDFFGTDAK